MQPRIRPLVFVFPMLLLAIVSYFRHAMSEVGARLEPEQLLKNPWILAFTGLTVGLSWWLLTTDASWVKDLLVASGS
jgi:decaprenyl-phosphate phosphoribosyltransferase